MKRSQLSKRLDDVRKSLSLAESSAMVGLDPSLCEVEVNRIASDETARYILIKNQPSGGLYTDGGVAQDRALDTGGDRAGGDSDTMDINNSNERVDIGSNKVVTSDDYQTDLKGDSISDITSNDTVGTSSGIIASTANDIGSIHDDRVYDNVVCIDDDKPNPKKDHVIIITADSIQEAAICKTDDSKVSTDSDTISDKVHLIDYSENITFDKTEAEVIVADGKAGILCDKRDIPCSKVDILSDKVDTPCDKTDIILCDKGYMPCDKVDMLSDKVCDKADILCDKADTLSDKMVTNNSTQVTTVVSSKLDVDVSKTDAIENRAIANQTKQTIDATKANEEPNSLQLALEPEETRKQPEEAQDLMLTAEAGTVSGEVELITSDSDSGMSLFSL